MTNYLESARLGAADAASDDHDDDRDSRRRGRHYQALVLYGSHHRSPALPDCRTGEPELACKQHVIHFWGLNLPAWPVWLLRQSTSCLQVWPPASMQAGLVAAG